MDSIKRKRKATFDPDRRVKVRRRDLEKAEAWEPPSEEDHNGPGLSLEEDSATNDDEEEEEEEGEEDTDEDEDEADDDGNATKASGKDDSNLSFGARLRLSQKRQNPKSKDEPGKDAGRGQRPERKARDADDHDNNKHSTGAGTTSSSSRSKAVAAALGRKTKSAPEEMSSKRPVSRYREVVKPPPNARPKPRDVRFEQELTGEDYRRFRRNYAFLDEYREGEMARLRDLVARRKGVTPEDRDDARRRLRAMEDEKRAQDRKDREQELLAEHKKKEKELVKQGKKPFFLKKSEQKKMLLLDKYAGMSKGQVDKAIEKKRKKVAGKEKKQLPLARRRTE